MDKRTLKEKQCAWAVAWQDHGDRAALAALVDSMRGLCVSVANKHQVSSEIWRDLMAECQVATMEAAGKFDRTRADGFSTLAVFMMYGRCRTALKRFVSPVSSSAHIALADAGSGITIDDGEEGVVLRAPVVDPFADQGLGLLPVLIQEAGLDDRQHDVLGRHARGETLEAVGIRWGVGATRVGQIEKVALGLVRAAAERRGLELRDLL